MPTRVKIVMMMAMTLRRLQATGQGRGIANDAPAVLIHIDKHAFSSFFFFLFFSILFCTLDFI